MPIRIEAAWNNTCVVKKKGEKILVLNKNLDELNIRYLVMNFFYDATLSTLENYGAWERNLKKIHKEMYKYVKPKNIKTLKDDETMKKTQKQSYFCKKTNQRS